MPSPAVIAKNDLVSFIEKLTVRLTENPENASRFPTSEEWGRIKQLVNQALCLNGLEIEPNHFLSWKNLARLEKAYRPHLSFRKLFDPFVAAVESDSCAYANLQKKHWKELCKDRCKEWGNRSLRVKVIDWLIYEVRDDESFLWEGKFPSFEEVQQKFENNKKAKSQAEMDTFYEMWAEAGVLLAEQLGDKFDD